VPVTPAEAQRAAMTLFVVVLAVVGAFSPVSVISAFLGGVPATWAIFTLAHFVTSFRLG
jgi:hypothetical protein